MARDTFSRPTRPTQEAKSMHSPTRHPRIRQPRLRNIVTGLVIAGAAFGVSAFAPAQTDENLLGKPVSNLDYQRAEVRDALKALFRQVNANYAITQDVQGYIEGRLTNATFEQALNFILRQVNATYRLEGGVVQIFPKETATGGEVTPTGDVPATKTAKIVRRIKIRVSDPYLIAILLGSDKGQQSFDLSPERSALNKLPQTGGGVGGGGGGLGGGGGGGGFGGGGGGIGGGGGGFGGGGGGIGGGGGGFGGGGGGFGGGGGGGFGR